MPYTRQQAEDILQSKFGFVWKVGSGRNPHQRLALFHNGKQVASTGFSRGMRRNSDVDDTLFMLIAREIRAQTSKNLRGMFDCNIGLKDYIGIISSQGLLR